LPFTAVHIKQFLDLALKVWRSILGHVFCFQQLVRIGEVVSINGSNLVLKARIVLFINVRAKNHKSRYPHPLTFPVEDRPHCGGNFLVEYIRRIGLKVGNPAHFLACKVAKKAGVVTGFPAIPVLLLTMMKEGKAAIKAIGLDPTRYALHSAKRSGALAGAEAGLDSARLTLVGQ
jgi:hypothetical protein